MVAVLRGIYAVESQARADGVDLDELRDIFGRLANGWPQARLRELLPAAWLADQRRQQQASDRAADAVATDIPAAA